MTQLNRKFNFKNDLLFTHGSASSDFRRSNLFYFIISIRLSSNFLQAALQTLDKFEWNNQKNKRKEKKRNILLICSPRSTFRYQKSFTDSSAFKVSSRFLFFCDQERNGSTRTRCRPSSDWEEEGKILFLFNSFNHF